MLDHVSVIICTYNRAEILKLCLQSFTDHAQAYKDRLEILVVANNCTDHTQPIFEEFNSKQIFSTRYIMEDDIGLSYARNRGAKEAKYDWLFYLDDDAFIIKNTLEKLFISVDDKRFLAFGGVYMAYYLDTKPKWIGNDFGTKITKLNKFDNLPFDEIIEGGVMVINKSIFDECGFFKINLGMKGESLGYGEETEFLERAKKKYTLGLNPELKVFHIVNKKKLNVFFHLKSYFILATYKRKTNVDLHLSIKHTYLRLPLRIIKYGLKVLINKNYYYQNFLWDSFNNTFYVSGYLFEKYVRAIITKK